MCTIKFLIRQPWLYILAGLVLLGMMVFSIIDANSSRHIVPFGQLQPYMGQVVAVQPAGQVDEKPRYRLTVALQGEDRKADQEANQSMQKQWLVVSDGVIPTGADVQAYVHQDQVYDLVVNHQRLIEYQDVIAHNVAKAQSAKATLTHPVTILLVLFLLGAGVVIEVFKRRHPQAYQKYCVCAMDRVKQMEQEGAPHS